MTAYFEVDLTPVSTLGMGAFANTTPTDPPPSVTTDEKERLRAAARKAEALFPGPIGRHLRTDLESWANCCQLRFDAKGVLAQCVDEILRMSPPDPPVAAVAA
jgi:hypothetical protein